MRPVLQLGCLFAACALSGAAADQKTAIKEPPPRPARAVRPPLPKGGGAGVPRQPRMSPPIGNPTSIAAHLYRATPEERDRALEKLPFPQQARIRKQLENFDQLPKPQQEFRIKQTELLAALPPERQAAVNQQMQAFNKLQPERRREIQMALRRLGALSDEERQRVFANDQFKSRFSADEQKMIADLVDIVPHL
jgi:hypothetical protein